MDCGGLLQAFIEVLKTMVKFLGHPLSGGHSFGIPTAGKMGAIP